MVDQRLPHIVFKLDKVMDLLSVQILSIVMEILKSLHGQDNVQFLFQHLSSHLLIYFGGQVFMRK